jgi:predicted nucleotidyltransferase
MQKTAHELTPIMWLSYKPFQRKTSRDSLDLIKKEALNFANALKQELVVRFRATKVILFGSLSRSDFKKHSDIDLAVWGISPPEFLKAVAFVTGISKTWEVNLVDADDCSSSLLHTILDEGIEL